MIDQNIRLTGVPSTGPISVLRATDILHNAPSRSQEPFSLTQGGASHDVTLPVEGCPFGAGSYRLQGITIAIITLPAVDKSLEHKRIPQPTAPDADSLESLIVRACNDASARRGRHQIYLHF